MSTPTMTASDARAFAAVRFAAEDARWGITRVIADTATEERSCGWVFYSTGQDGQPLIDNPPLLITHDGNVVLLPPLPTIRERELTRRDAAVGGAELH